MKYTSLIQVFRNPVFSNTSGPIPHLEETLDVNKQGGDAHLRKHPQD